MKELLDMKIKAEEETIRMSEEVFFLKGLKEAVSIFSKIYPDWRLHVSVRKRLLVC